MSKINLMYVINREIKFLNSKIDRKIVRGISYEREARKHRELVHKLRRLESEASMDRTFSLSSVFASFLF